MPDESTAPDAVSFTALSLAVGLVLGGLVGLITGNLIIFAGGGLVLGLAIGYAVDQHTRGQDVAKGT